MKAETPSSGIEVGPDPTIEPGLTSTPLADTTSRARPDISVAGVRDALARVQDPELPIGIVDLGLVYGIRVAGGEVEVDLTHTAIGCPAMDMMREDVEAAVLALPGAERVRVRTVWDPPWTKARLTPRGRAVLLACGIGL